MEEWYALAAIERWRESLSDLKSWEEDAIFEHSMRGSGALFLRNIIKFNADPEGVWIGI